MRDVTKFGIPVQSNQINKWYPEGFEIVITVDGVERQPVRRENKKFSDVKNEGVRMLQKSLENRYGRGEHVLRIYGMVLAGVRDIQIGENQWRYNNELIRSDCVFEL